MARPLRLVLTVLAVVALSATMRFTANGTSAPYRLASYSRQSEVHARQTFNQQAATYAQTIEGVPYVYGGSSLEGFDCSGLTQYVYRHLGMDIQRTAEAQYLEFRPESHARSVPGDLVFFHETSDPDSYVYHVAIYEGGEYMVAASSGAGRVEWESFSWAGDTVTFGTISH